MALAALAALALLARYGESLEKDHGVVGPAGADVAEAAVVDSGLSDGDVDDHDASSAAGLAGRGMEMDSIFMLAVAVGMVAGHHAMLARTGPAARRCSAARPSGRSSLCGAGRGAGRGGDSRSKITPEALRPAGTPAAPASPTQGRGSLHPATPRAAAPRDTGRTHTHTHAHTHWHSGAFLVLSPSHALRDSAAERELAARWRYIASQLALARPHSINNSNSDSHTGGEARTGLAAWLRGTPRTGRGLAGGGNAATRGDAAAPLRGRVC